MSNEPKHYPKPEYCFCNAGHQLTEVFDEKRNAFIWDCPTCTQRMEDAEEIEEEVGA